MRSKISMILTITTLLLFPIIMNFLSPVVSVSAAMEGIIAGSVVVFAVMFLMGLFLGRAWCSWLCPMSALGDLCGKVNNKPVNIKKLRVVRLIIFGIWAAALVTGFVLSGGIKKVDFLYFTETGISVDMPIKYIFYYLVLISFVVTNILVGRRGACHSFCWMSPFMAGGFALGRLLKIPQLRIKADTTKCIGCGKCSKNCPMSIPVSQSAKKGCILTSDCILCGACVDGCPKKVLIYGVITNAARRQTLDAGLDKKAEV